MNVVVSDIANQNTQGYDDAMHKDTEKTAKLRRRWLRFRVRTLLIVVTVLSILLGWICWELEQIRKEQSVAVWVNKLGGKVYISSHYQNTIVDFQINKSSWEKTKEQWFGERVPWVNLSNTAVRDLSPLADLKKLTWLYLSNTPVSDLSPLADMKYLTTLHLDNTQVSDLMPLAEMKNLKSLVLVNTRVSDLSPLEKLTNLKVLYLMNTQVNDISQLVQLRNLRSLHLYGTPVSDEQVQELRQTLPNCRIHQSIHFGN